MTHSDRRRPVVIHDPAATLPCHAFSSIAHILTHIYNECHGENVRINIKNRFPPGQGRPWQDSYVLTPSFNLIVLFLKPYLGHLNSFFWISPFQSAFFHQDERSRVAFMSE